MALQCGADIVALNGGMIHENGLYMLRGKVPLPQMIQAQTCWLNKVALALFGPFVVPRIDFEELFFRDFAVCVLRSLARLQQLHLPSS